MIGLVKPCRECRQAVDRRAKVCPHCHVDRPGLGGFMYVVTHLTMVLFGVMMLLVAIGAAGLCLVILWALFTS